MPDGVAAVAFRLFHHSPLIRITVGAGVMAGDSWLEADAQLRSAIGVPSRIRAGTAAAAEEMELATTFTRVI